MPHTRSAKKRWRQGEKRRQRNRITLRQIKTQIKRVDAVVEAGEADAVKTEAILAIKKLDKAAVRRVIHPNQAARKKSQLARLMNKQAAVKQTT